MTLDPLAIVDFAQKLTVIGMLILIVVGGHRRVWVYGWYADELRTRLNKLEEQRDHAVSTARQAVNVTEKVT